MPNPTLDSQLKSKQFDETTSSWGGVVFDAADFGIDDGLGNYVPSTPQSAALLLRASKGQVRFLTTTKTFYYLDREPEDAGVNWVPVEPWPVAGAQTISSSTVTRVVQASETEVFASNWGQRLALHDDAGSPTNTPFKTALSAMSLSAVSGSDWSEALWNVGGQGSGVVSVAINGAVVPHLHEDSLASQAPFADGIHGWLYRAFGGIHYLCFFRPSPDGLNKRAHPSVTVPDASYSAASAEEAVPLSLVEGDVVSITTVSIAVV